jgi:uncharacterized membrane protein YoaK (UPF0700 family)
MISTHPRAESKALGNDLLRPLMILTTTTGVVDAISFVGLGRVFTANMTGNVVFLGFALGGAEALSIQRSLAALTAFAIGAMVAGLVTNRPVIRTQKRQLAFGAGTEAALLAVAAAIAVGQTPPLSSSLAYALIVLTALAMGVRNAVVRKLGVADLTTTVLTLTITGLAGDAPFVGGQGTRSGRKALSIVLMLIGALIGTMLFLNWGFTVPLALSAVLASTVAVATVKN